MRKTSLIATAIFMSAILMAVWFPPEIPISAKRDGDVISVKVKNVTVYVPSKEDVPGVFVKFPDFSIQYVPLRR